MIHYYKRRQGDRLAHVYETLLQEKISWPTGKLLWYITARQDKLAD